MSAELRGIKFRKEGLKSRRWILTDVQLNWGGGVVLFSTWLINGDIMFFNFGHRNGRCDLLLFD